jgi:hypothetical protein
LMALSRHFWGMTGDEEFFTPLLLIPSWLQFVWVCKWNKPCLL